MTVSPHVLLRILLLAAAVLAPCALAPGVARAQEDAVDEAADPFTVVLTREALRAAGVVRLGDVWTLLDGWRVASTDDFAADVSAGGLSPFGGEVLVLVDGQPVEAALLGTGSLNALPLHLSAVERIEATSVPTVAAGRFAPAGVLRIVTRTPDPGATLRGGAGAGNETGDPGPFRYTPFATPNVDRVGPNAWAASSLAGRGLYAEAGIHTDEHHATDARMVDRVRLLYDDLFNPRLLQTAPTLRAGVDGRGGRHRLLAGYSRLQDLRYLPALGRELPLVLNTTHVGVSGATAPEAGAGLSYRASYTRLDVDPRSNRAGIDLDLREDRLRTYLAVRSGASRLGVTGGVGVEHTRIVTVQPLARPGVLLGRLDVAAHARMGAVAAELAGAAVASEERVGVKALGRASARLGAAGTLALHATFARRLPEERRDAVGWFVTGYRLPPAAEASEPSLPYVLVGHAFTADAAWTVRPVRTLAVTARGGYRRFDRQTVAVYSFGVGAEGVGFTPAVRGVVDAPGAVLVGEGEVAWRPGRRLTVRAHYSYTRPVSENVFFWRLWRPLPWHLAAGEVRAAPNDRLVLWARARWTGDTVWPAYAGAEAATGGRYDETLPATLAVDAAVTKRFWGDHLLATLALRNALGASLRSHPGGAVTRLGLYVALRARFHAGL